MTILHIEYDPATRTVRLTGELDLCSAPDLAAALASDVDRGSDLHLDLRGLTFMDSTGLHLIVDTTRALTGGAALILIGPTPPVTRVLELAAIVGRVPNLRMVPDAGTEAGGEAQAGAPGCRPLHTSLTEAQTLHNRGRHLA